jgi:hypothetical protein
MVRRSTFLLSLGSALAFPQRKYDGPRPSKPDVLYLQHATNLIETEVIEAKEEKRKDDLVYFVPGASSSARTPMAEPIFLLESKSLLPDKLELYRFEVKNGRREVVRPAKRRKDSARPLHLSLRKLADGLYRVEANEFLANGEYAITPSDSNKVFCFQVY